MDYAKPTISLSFDRTHWSLTLPSTYGDGGFTFELRVRHYAPEDSFSFHRFDAGDENELVSKAEFEERRQAIVDHEGCGHCYTDGCANPDGASVAVEGDGQMLAHWVCEVCKDKFPLGIYQHTPLDRSDALNRADAILAAKGVEVMSRHHADILAHLRRTWDAFALLFNPSTTL